MPYPYLLVPLPIPQININPLLRYLFLPGNNRIDSLEQILRIRQIRSLKMLTLMNNPIAKETDYRMLVLAYVDSITYLDYALIDPQDRQAAKEAYHDELLDIEEKESVLAEKTTRDQQLEEYVKKLDTAGE
ncbi:hypothetical protein EON65_41925 [archaeon]|nr:MAG: hypothetical protein EON65_41925 [archaeon]